MKAIRLLVQAWRDAETLNELFMDAVLPAIMFVLMVMAIVLVVVMAIALVWA